MLNILFNYLFTVVVSFLWGLAEPLKAQPEHFEEVLSEKLQMDLELTLETALKKS